MMMIIVTPDRFRGAPSEYNKTRRSEHIGFARGTYKCSIPISLCQDSRTHPTASSRPVNISVEKRRAGVAEREAASSVLVTRKREWRRNVGLPGRVVCTHTFHSDSLLLVGTRSQQGHPNEPDPRSRSGLSGHRTVSRSCCPCGRSARPGFPHAARTSMMWGEHALWKPSVLAYPGLTKTFATPPGLCH